MGFFRRWFRLRERHPQHPDSGWATSERGTELVLHEAEAAALLDEVDIEGALAHHLAFRDQLQAAVVAAAQGGAPPHWQPEALFQSDRCMLGQWLHGSGRERLGHYPAFQILVARHRYFHEQAAAAVALAQAGQPAHALQRVQGSCRHASNQVVLLMRELQRGLQR
ncbi:MAG: CZB domain-containing protein [Burkholderiaceae bacterium]